MSKEERFKYNCDAYIICECDETIYDTKECEEYDNMQKATNWLNNQDQKIADLETKLAESEEYNKMLLEEKGGYIDLVSGYSKKCKNYEQQLAEKEKEIEALKQKK